MQTIIANGAVPERVIRMIAEAKPNGRTRRSFSREWHKDSLGQPYCIGHISSGNNGFLTILRIVDETVPLRGYILIEESEAKRGFSIRRAQKNELGLPVCAVRISRHASETEIRKAANQISALVKNAGLWQKRA